MPNSVPHNVPAATLSGFLAALADDELMLGHRDSEWTGHAPILEEDIAFSNIAQDELGHALALYALHEKVAGITPDSMAFERTWEEFRCCRFVTYPKGDFAYTVVRQFLFDTAEHVRLTSLLASSFSPLSDLAAKILAEEAYHLLHTQGLVERLGDSTEEGNRRMQQALDLAFPQALGMFEPFPGERDLVDAGVIVRSEQLRLEWLGRIARVLESTKLAAPVRRENGEITPTCRVEDGGRRGEHTEFLKQLVGDLQHVYRTVPGGKW